jgi:hypothetical protein
VRPQVQTPVPPKTIYPFRAIMIYVSFQAPMLIVL